MSTCRINSAFFSTSHAIGLIDDEIRFHHPETKRKKLFMIKIYFLFSDFMQKGASLSASQLIKLITRGKTSRLSADPLLDFFRPLEAWLEAQNRDEPVNYFN